MPDALFAEVEIVWCAACECEIEAGGDDLCRYCADEAAHDHDWRDE